MRRLSLILPAFALFTLAACQSGGSGLPATGRVTPTVADGQPSQFESYATARSAFARGSENGIVNAILKDAAWLRMSGEPDAVMAQHRDYFDQGYTSFEVVFRPTEYVRPTKEVFILEDSKGTRLTASPEKYKGEMLPVDDRFQFTFDLAFRHGLSADVKWIRLTREKDGETVEWTFP